MIEFGDEVGRVFVHCDRVAAIEDCGCLRWIFVRSQGGHSIAMWNPGEATAKKMEDLGELGWRTMLCVESANLLEDRVTILPCATHTSVVTYSVENLA